MQVNLLESILKVDSVIEMTFLYDARYSIVLLRPKNRLKLLTQSAENRIYMGKWACESLGIYFLKDEKAPDDRTFLT